MKKKNKTIKKLGIVALVAMMFLSASAWLTSRQTAAGVNKIKTGETSIRFANQANAITLTGNDSIPMTKDYAIANLTPYVFDIENDGTIALDYKISVSAEGYNSTFPAGKVNLIIAEVDNVANAKTALTAASVQKVAMNKGIALKTNFVADASQKYVLLAYVDEATTNAEYLTKSITFKLEVNAVQAGVEEITILPETTMTYASVTKSQIPTSITVGGETKNVEVYNIEGDSKTELLNKLDESGLANSADVDALIEVKGEDYDGLNSVATFDLTDTANPGDTVVILHFNETSQEWEYIGTETVGDNNTVKGNFTSYSPVAFVVIKNGTSSGEGSGSESGEGGSSETETSVLTLKFSENTAENASFLATKTENGFSSHPNRYIEITLLNSEDINSDFKKVGFSCEKAYFSKNAAINSYNYTETAVLPSLYKTYDDDPSLETVEINKPSYGPIVAYSIGYNPITANLDGYVCKGASFTYNGSPLKVVDANGTVMDNKFDLYFYDAHGSYNKADIPA